MALTAVAAVLLGIAVLGTQDNVVTQLDKPEQTPTATEALITRLPRRRRRVVFRHVRVLRRAKWLQ